MVSCYEPCQAWAAGLSSQVNYLGFIELLKEKEIPESKKLCPEVVDIKRAVCRHYEIEEAELQKSRRGLENEARDLAIYLGVRLILRSKLGKMTVDEKRPEMLPAIAQHERSKCKNSLTAMGVNHDCCR